MPQTLDAPLTATTTATTRLLIIDDEPSIRESLETLLTLEGFSVTLAPDGPAGLDLLSRHDFDLLLLDLALPGESGIVSYGILQEHGGKITVDSTPGEGTTFRLEIPAVIAAEPRTLLSASPTHV